MRWPATWADPARLDLLKDSAIDSLVIDTGDRLEAVRSRAKQTGLQIVDPQKPPDGIRILKGEWPGVRSGQGGSAGPTGVAWVDSNGWTVQLTRVMHPDCAAWIDAAPPQRVFPASYLTAVADAAAFGGRWIVTLDDGLASGLAGGNANAQSVWKTIGHATSFFKTKKDWEAFRPAGVAGVISDFTGDNEFFSHEMLNLSARAGQHTLPLRKDQVTAASMRGLRAVLYADAKPPEAALRKEILAFVEAGGTLVTTPVWGAVTGSREEHPRFVVARAGKGRIARSVEAPDDPWQFANDGVIVISHRHDLVRFWNAGSAGSSYLVAPDGKRAVVNLLFYANRGPDSASVRVAGPFRKVKASMVDTPEIAGVKTEAQKDAVEIYLPQVSQFVSLELSV
jgi:hypothetical protein